MSATATVEGIKVTIRHAAGSAGELTVEDAKKILGWQTEEEHGKKFGNKFFLVDKEGNKVRLLNNVTNRPFKKNLSERYANEMLRKEWKLNGETMVIDEKGHVQSAQHRLIALVFANQIFQKDYEDWKGYGHKKATGVTIPALIVEGISHKNEVADTLDTGTPRRLGDVVFRNKEFGKKLTDKDQRKLSWALAIGLRLLWIRMNGKTVSNAKHFPHSEAMNVQNRHSRMVDATIYVWEQDKKLEDRANLINDYLTLGYATALFYLMATSATTEDGETNFDNWGKAEAFWSEFATSEADLFKALRAKLVNVSQSGSDGRDEVCGTIVKGWLLFLSGTLDGVTAKDITVKRKKVEGKIVFAEFPRIGGLDVDLEPVIEDGGEEVEEEAEEAAAE